MSDVVVDIERAIGGYEEGAWVPESHATIEHISLMRRAASELALLRTKLERTDRVVEPFLAEYRAGREHCPICRWRLGGHMNDCSVAALELIKEQEEETT